MCVQCSRFDEACKALKVDAGATEIMYMRGWCMAVILYRSATYGQIRSDLPRVTNAPSTSRLPEKTASGPRRFASRSATPPRPRRPGLLAIVHRIYKDEIQQGGDEAAEPDRG